MAIVPRKYLSADPLYRTCLESFQDVDDSRTGIPIISLPDALMSGFAMFTLKDPSMLAFDGRRKRDAKNLQMIFGMEHVPSDTRMREILDPVDFEQLRPAFRNVFTQIAKGKDLRKLRFLDQYYLLSLDGTGYFSSHDIHCPGCMEKHHANGSVTYHHQMLGAAIVCPGRKEVIPVMPEPIFKQDGQTKNDCERNALKRFLPKFRQDHPHLPTIALLDALYANAPVIRDLKRDQLSWIIRVKADGNSFLFGRVEELSAAGLTEEFEVVDSDGVHRRYRLARNVQLNESNADILVDFLEVSEPHVSNSRRSFTWIIDPLLGLRRDQAEAFMRAGRSRWKIENETFNTLKNQGYQFEHNFGHGHYNLSIVLVMLMMLAFLVDQTQQLCCPLFTAAWNECKSKRALWERIREIFHQFQVVSMQAIHEAILSDAKPSVDVVFDL